MVSNPASWVLSADTVGQFAKAEDETSGQLRYILVACLVVPVDKSGRPGLGPDQEMPDQAALEACEEDAYAMSLEEKECAVKGLQWKEVVFTEMMKKKTPVAVEQALVRIIAELTQLGLPISRFHSDSGTDFIVSPQMRKLVTRLNMKQTCSASEEHNSNGRIENIVQMRAYLHSPGADVNMWGRGSAGDGDAGASGGAFWHSGSSPCQDVASTVAA